MRGTMHWLAAAIAFFVSVNAQAKPAPEKAADALAGPSFPVGNMSFTIPAKWQIEPVESPARGGQWRVPPLKGDERGGEIVAFYFGPGAGGSAKENIEAWISTMSTADGHPADKQWQYQASGLKVSEVVI